MQVGWDYPVGVYASRTILGLFARKCVGVQLLGELLLYGNHGNDRSGNTAKFEPVCSGDFLYVIDEEVGRSKKSV